MMEIKLDDENSHKKKKKNSTVINAKYSMIDFKNEGNTYYKNEINKKAATIISKDDKHNNIYLKKENNILIIDELNNDSKESDYFYKFIIDNVNDSEDEFQKKLEKVLKKVENKRKQNKNKKKLIKDKKTVVDKTDEIFRSNSVKNPKKRDNLFIYSEKTKNLMENEEIDISSIDNDDQNIHKNHIVKNNVKLDKNNIFFGEKEKNFIEDKNDSLESFLSELK